MSVTKLITLNAVGGAYTDITAAIPCRRVDIREDESVTAQGLQYELADDGFSAVYNCGTPGTPDQSQITLGNKLAHGNNDGPVLGYPAQKVVTETIAATVLAKIKSRTAATTTIRVTYYE